MSSGNEAQLLQINDLVKHFPVKRGVVLQRTHGMVRAVDGVTLDVPAGKTVGLVGESGCGKSTLGRLMVHLLTPTSGRVVLDGRDITELSAAQMRPLRRQVQMVFQDPVSSLNPRRTVGSILGAPFRLQGVQVERGVKHAVQDLLERVGLNPEHYNRYPHEFSGGQAQRIGIARALALRPKLIVCDEPVSALDVSVQAQILNLMQDLQQDYGLTYVFIAHDLSVVRHIADRVAVMYLGHLVEVTDQATLYRRPLHPYTQALLSAVPVADPDAGAERERIVLRGDVPNPIAPPAGCPFHTRCWKAEERCRIETPPLLEPEHAHHVACHFPEPRDVVPTRMPRSPRTG